MRHPPPILKSQNQQCFVLQVASYHVSAGLAACQGGSSYLQPLLWEGNSALYSICNVIAVPVLATCWRTAPLSSNTHLKFLSELFIPIIFLWDGNVVVLALLLAQQLIPWRKRESGCYCTSPHSTEFLGNTGGLVSNRENQAPMLRNWTNGSEFSCRVTSHRLEISSALRRQRKERPWSHSWWSGPSPTPPPSAGGPCLWPSACCRTPGWHTSARISLSTRSIIMLNEFTLLVAQMNGSSLLDLASMATDDKVRQYWGPPSRNQLIHSQSKSLVPFGVEVGADGFGLLLGLTFGVRGELELDVGIRQAVGIHRDQIFAFTHWRGDKQKRERCEWGGPRMVFHSGADMLTAKLSHSDRKGYRKERSISTKEAKSAANGFGWMRAHNRAALKPHTGL